MSPFILTDLIDHAAHGKIANATKLANEYILLETNPNQPTNRDTHNLQKTIKDIFVF